ncbi:hypothetical protein [Rhodohalobacter sp. 614A]|uniref:hypothetical protein n=1 Tax=Rhodohalobacter sp. 614A TaxID=2908649 RepID=UPI001F2985F4|nr:hypothetical protein [Rhodohalobacter sp. 614A]
MTRTLSCLFIVFAFSLLTLSCDTTDSGNDQEEIRFKDGIPVEVMNLLGEDMLKVIENDLKMPIHRGDNPPDIVAMLSKTAQEKSSGAVGKTVVMSPLLLLETNVPSDAGSYEPGHEFIDEYFRLSSNPDEFLVIVERRSVSPSDGKIYATSIPADFMVGGEGNRFTIYGQNETVYEDKEGTSLAMRIFSGVFTEDGAISSPHYSIFMIDDGGVEDIIPSGTGRSFMDGDGFATVTTWPEE